MQAVHTHTKSKLSLFSLLHNHNSKGLGFAQEAHFITVLKLLKILAMKMNAFAENGAFFFITVGTTNRHVNKECIKC